LKALEAMQAPTLKRNLDIGEDWKKVECLSWEDVTKIFLETKSIFNKRKS